MIVLEYLLCGVLFVILNSISVALLRHCIREIPRDRDESGIAGWLFEIAFWPIGLTVKTVAWSILIVRAVSAYLTAARLNR